MRKSLCVFLLVLAPGAVEVACGSNPSPSQVCAPNQWRACTGTRGCEGGQRCTPDGKAWGSCECNRSCTTGQVYECLAGSGCTGTQTCLNGRSLSECVCPTLPDGGNAASDAFTPGDAGSGDGAMTQVRACFAECVTPADCSQNVPSMDADNYASEEGGCRYTGCNSDAECQAIGPWVCR